MSSNGNGKGNNEVLNLLKQLSEAQQASHSGAQSAPPTNADAEPLNRHDESQSIEVDVIDYQQVQHNPSDIDDYKTALRHVVFKTAQDRHTMGELQQLIKEQADQEKKWIDGRKEILDRHAKQNKSQQEFDNVYKLVGKVSKPAKPSTTESESNTRELQNHDTQMYRAMVSLSHRQEQVLARLELPLFCKPGANSKELVESRRKILQVIQDLLV